MKTTSLFISIGLFFMSFLACRDTVNNPPPYENILNLPPQPYAYADLALPAYLQVDSILETDNTPADNPITDWGATLGRVLFYDKMLSQNKSISCASCHEAKSGFSDAKQFSDGFKGGKTGRNSMGLANARFYADQAFFWDERAPSLEAQVLLPIQDHVEMGMTLEEVISRLAENEYYPYLFEKAYGEPQIDEERVAKAMAQFIRSMVSLDTKYDQGRIQVDDFNQDFPNFSEMENEGKDIFYNQLRGNCAACHLPETFSGKEAFNVGLELDYPDKGIGGHLNDSNFNGVFKVPSLKNIELTAPYMHDGRFETLEEVVEFYNEDVKEHPNLGDPLRFWLPDGPPRPLFLSESEEEALVAFLKTLTDEAMIQNPKWSDPFIY